jgi:hypothetical protein
LSDLEWLPKVVTGWGLEKARAGHVAFAWKDTNGKMNYVSFFPNNAEVFRRAQELVNSGIPQDQATCQAKQETPGIFKEFHKDLDLYSRLPSKIKRNLEWDGNSISYMGAEIQGWDTQKLTAALNQIKQNTPAFDLKSRGNAKSCSTVVLDLIDSSVKRGSFEHLNDIWGTNTVGRLKSGSLVKTCNGLIFLAISPIALPVFCIAGIASETIQRGERMLREGSSINPNYVAKVFSFFPRYLADNGQMYERFEKTFD